MTDLNVEKILRGLAAKYGPFINEEDFQKHFAQEILDQFTGSHVFLECCPYPFESSISIDICVVYRNIRHLIELKYKTRTQAVDLSCYDFVKDIRRIETLNALSRGSVGYAIFLTNRSIFWRGTDDTTSDYYPFQIRGGKELRGIIDWQDRREKKGTGRQDPIHLEGRYRLEWRDYCKSRTSDCYEGNEKFRVLIVSV